MSLDEHRLTVLMRDSVESLRHPNRWSEVPGRAAKATRRRRVRQLAAGTIITAAAAITAVVAIAPARPHSHHVQVSHQPGATTSRISPTSPPISPLTSPPVSGSPTSSAELPAGYLPLFPFRSSADVAGWEHSRSLGPDYLDARQTALAFAHFLGYTGVTEIVSVSSASDGDHVSVGFTIPGGGAHTAAIVHLVRFGQGENAPWEVVGTDDTTLTLTVPGYGSIVSGPLTVGGKITGVDESITVRLFRPGVPAAVAVSCCHAAGGTGTPWSVRVPKPTAAGGGILIIAASTGGHVAQVERFAVTAARFS